MRTSLSYEEISFKKINTLSIAMDFLQITLFLKPDSH